MPTNPSKFKILEYIQEIPDPRLRSSLNYKHPLTSIIFIAFVATLCGANNWVETVVVTKGMQDWIQQFVELPFGALSSDTFERVFRLINPKELTNFLVKWMALAREKLSADVISFDGKTLCGTAEKGMGLKGVHILHAWSKENGICIGQLKVDNKSNEITAVPELIKLLDLKDCIITSDALNTQKTIADEIKNAGADYVLPVKENHPGLLKDIKCLFGEASKKDFKGVSDHYETKDKGHSRIEKRGYHVIDGKDLPNKELWPGVKSLGMVIRERTIKSKTTKEIEYYISIIKIDAKLFEYAVRSHWGVESLHWYLDVVFREDDNRYRDKIGAQNLSILRKIVLGVLTKDKSKKCGGAAKRLAAAVNSNYRENILKNFL